MGFVYGTVPWDETIRSEGCRRVCIQVCGLACGKVRVLQACGHDQTSGEGHTCETRAPGSEPVHESLMHVQSETIIQGRENYAIGRAKEGDQ